MSDLSPIALLVDADGNAVEIVLDGAVYKLSTITKVRNVAGTIVNPATEDKLEAVRVLIASLDGKDFATQTTLVTLATESKLEAVRVLLNSLDGKDYATETTQATLATESTLAVANALLTSIDGKDFATEMTLAAADAKLAAIGVLLTSLDGKDFATETTLAAIRDTDGIKKIVDALPVGDNVIGQIKITADSGFQVSIHYENSQGMLAIRDEGQLEILRGIWRELHVIRQHLVCMTGERIDISELEDSEDIGG